MNYITNKNTFVLVFMTLTKQINYITDKNIFVHADQQKEMDNRYDGTIKQLMLTQRVVETSLHPCVTSERSFKVVPTYTSAKVIGCKGKPLRF